jgi:uncharacterized membrane protein
MVYLFLPCLTGFGSTITGVSGRNTISLLGITMIAILVIVNLKDDVDLVNLRPLAIFGIACGLLVNTAMVSKYNYGFDINLEYFVYMSTDKSGFWNIGLSKDSLTGTYNAMLSVTILPTIISQVSGLTGEVVFKLVYVPIFALVPVILYKLLRKNWEEKIAWISVMFFISNYTFYNEMVTLARQMIAEVFMSLLVLLLVSRKTTTLSGRFAYMMLAFGLVASHYTVALVFLLPVLCVSVYSFFRGTRTAATARSVTLFMLVMTLSWYVFTYSPVDAIVGVGKGILPRVISDLFNPEARDPNVLVGLGIGGPAQSTVQYLGRLFSYVTELFVILGILSLLWKKNRANLPGEVVALSVAGFALVGLGIVVPHFASSINMTRIYHLGLFFLAPFFVVGGQKVVTLVSKPIGPWGRQLNRQRILSMLVLAVLLPYLLFNTGVVQEVTGDIPFSRPLSGYRMDRRILDNFVIRDAEVVGAEWTTRETSPASTFYADRVSKLHVLASYGVKLQDNILFLYEDTQTVQEGSYVFLRELNVQNGIIIEPGFREFNLSSTALLVSLNSIYSNGGCEVYYR